MSKIVDCSTLEILGLSGPPGNSAMTRKTSVAFATILLVIAACAPQVPPPSQAPTISYSAQSYTFTAAVGESNPPSQIMEIWNSGGGTLDWAVSHDVGWLSLDPMSGSFADEGISVTISVDISGMSAGSYSGTITISAPGATNTPQTISIVLGISPPPLVEELLQPRRIVQHPPTADNPYAFYSYFPRSAVSNEEVWLAVWPHGGAFYSTDYSVHKTQARVQLSRLIEYSEQYRMAIVVVAIPNTWDLYVHSLHTGTFTTTDEMLRRPDLKLIDAVWNQYIPLIQTAGLTVNERVLMLGYSSPGMFAHRFTMLHPSRVKAVWLGGEAPAPLPAEELYGYPLDYPLGIRNLEALTGDSFDFETYRMIPHFICVGENDVKPENDTTTGTSIFTEEQRLFIRSHFGRTNPQRIEFFYEYLVSAGVPAEFRLYRGVGHQLLSYMLHDAFDFLTRSTE